MCVYSDDAIAAVGAAVLVSAIDDASITYERIRRVKAYKQLVDRRDSAWRWLMYSDVAALYLDALAGNADAVRPGLHKTIMQRRFKLGARRAKWTVDG